MESERSGCNLVGKLGECQLERFQRAVVEAICPWSGDAELHCDLGERFPAVVVQLDDPQLPRRQTRDGVPHPFRDASVVCLVVRMWRREIRVMGASAPCDRRAGQLGQHGDEIRAASSKLPRLWCLPRRVDGRIVLGAPLGSQSTMENAILSIAAPETVEDGAANAVMRECRERGAARCIEASRGGDEPGDSEATEIFERHREPVASPEPLRDVLDERQTVSNLAIPLAERRSVPCGRRY